MPQADETPLGKEGIMWIVYLVAAATMAIVTLLGIRPQHPQMLCVALICCWICMAIQRYQLGKKP
jgi:hypothetical protein